MTLRRAMLLLGLLTTLWCLPGAAVRATRGAHVAVDEPQYLLSATSLAEDLDLDIADELRDERWREYHERPLPEQTKPLPGGRRVSPHDPLLPLLLAVPMAVGGWVAAKATLALLAGTLAASLLWVAVVRLRVPLPRAAAGVACFSLASPLAVYATQVYPELPGALALTLGVGAALGPASRRTALGVGLAVTAMPWLSVKYAPAAAALVLVFLLRLLRAGDRRLALELVGGLAASGVVFAVGHLAVYGSLTPYATGDHFNGADLNVVGFSPNYPARTRRLLGLFVDRSWGLVAWQPAWLLLLPALGALARRRPPWWPVVALPLAAGWATATWLALTMQGFWWSGRQTVVVLPMAVLVITWWARRSLLLAGLVVGAITWWWLVVDGLAERITWVVHVSEAGSPFHRLLRPLLPELRSLTDGDVARYVAWAVVAVVLVVLGWRSAAGGDEDAGAGEGADADGAVLDLDRDRAVG